MSESTPPPPAQLAVKPNAAVRFEIVHEDHDLLVVEKPVGLVTQPGKGHETDSLLNGVFALNNAQHGKVLQNLGARRDYGLLHRLDKDTSGLLVIAKTPNAYDQLRRDFESRNIDKDYFAITCGVPQPRQGVIQARLKEVTLPNGDYASIKKVVISRQGQEAISAYRVISSAPADKPTAALVRVTIKTGRLHQIRAHMLFVNAPLFGDNLYTLPEAAKISKTLPRPPRLALHAARLGFKHPSTGRWVHFERPLPADLAAFAAKLGLTT